MSAQSSLLPASVTAEIDSWLAKYPADKKQSALLPALHIVQDFNQGWLSEALLDAVAEYLQLPKIAVYEVATFYSMYDLKPVGRHKVAICTNISCMLKGCDALAEQLQKKLGIGFDETTADGRFTLKRVECLGACGGAPVVQIDKDYHENANIEKIDALLEGLE